MTTTTGSYRTDANARLTLKDVRECASLLGSALRMKDGEVSIRIAPATKDQLAEYYFASDYMDAIGTLRYYFGGHERIEDVDAYLMSRGFDPKEVK